MDKLDEQRSIKIVERKVDTALGTITYQIQVDTDIFKYKSKEEIAEMIERRLRYATIKYALNDISSREQAFIITKRREET